MNPTTWDAQLREIFRNEPMTALALVAALGAIATTPIAFAVLGRMQWFKARRGRVLQTPEFSSIVCAMLLVMGIPAIFAALVLKSRTYDKNRYEFDPNKTWSVLEQGRGYESLKQADEAVKREMARLAEERKNLVESVKKLDESMLALRAVAGTSAAVSQKVPPVLQRLAAVRKSVGVDGPQQLMDFTAPPVELAAVGAGAGLNPAAQPATAAVPGAAPTSAPAVAANANAAPAAAPAASAAGLPKATVEAEIATVPDPQKPIAGMLPLAELPPGWVVGASGEKHLETFNADNLFEKIDGRAESFIQYNVKGMAYTYYHPEGDESNEVQLYIFEMSDPLKALGKYGSEKPDDAKVVALGSEGYTTAGSTLFYADKYYTQIVSTKDDPKFAAFALDLAKRIAGKQKPDAPAPAVVANEGTGSAGGGKPAVAANQPATPEMMFGLLPSGQGKSGPTYVAQDVFGYAFLSDVFLAEYSEKGASWKGFLRPYGSPEEARTVFEKYVESVKQDGAEIKDVKAEGADRMIVASNIGLFDALFLKGNTLAGAAGATEGPAAEAFAKTFAKALPAKVPVIGGSK